MNNLVATLCLVIICGTLILLIMIWMVILMMLAIGFVFMCADKFRAVMRKERERRSVIDEKELHELYEQYKDLCDLD